MMYQDAVDLLNEDVGFWIAYTEQVWLQYEDHEDQAYGVYNWRHDIHVFYVKSHGPDVIVVCHGPTFDSTWNFYTGDPILCESFRSTFQKCTMVAKGIASEPSFS